MKRYFYFFHPVILPIYYPSMVGASSLIWGLFLCWLWRNFQVTLSCAGVYRLSSPLNFLGLVIVLLHSRVFCTSVKSDGLFIRATYPFPSMREVKIHFPCPVDGVIIHLVSIHREWELREVGVAHFNCNRHKWNHWFKKMFALGAESTSDRWIRKWTLSQLN